MPRTTKHSMTRKTKPRALQLLCISPPNISETLLRNVWVANWRRIAIVWRHRAGLSPLFDTQIRTRLGKRKKSKYDLNSYEDQVHDGHSRQAHPAKGFRPRFQRRLCLARACSIQAEGQRAAPGQISGPAVFLDP